MSTTTTTGIEESHEILKEKEQVLEGSSESSTNTKDLKSLETDADIIKIEFECCSCGYKSLCDYKGLQSKFARSIKFNEDCYVIRDPFSAPPTRLTTNKANSEYFVVIGSDCNVCGRQICSSNDCSLYYTKTFCLMCAMQCLSEFPLEIQIKIKKQLAASSSSTLNDNDD